MKERNIARANLQKVIKQWNDYRDLKGKAWAQRNKFKRHLEDWELCRSGADSGWYPSRTTDTCDGVTRRLVPCAPRGATKGLLIRDND